MPVKVWDGNGNIIYSSPEIKTFKAVDLSIPLRGFRFVLAGRIATRSATVKPSKREPRWTHKAYNFPPEKLPKLKRCLQSEVVPPECEPSPSRTPHYLYTVKANAAIHRLLNATVTPFHEMEELPEFPGQFRRPFLRKAKRSKSV